MNRCWRGARPRVRRSRAATQPSSRAASNASPGTPGFTLPATLYAKNQKTEKLKNRKPKNKNPKPETENLELEIRREDGESPPLALHPAPPLAPLVENPKNRNSKPETPKPETRNPKP